eukprot:1080747_1
MDRLYRYNVDHQRIFDDPAHRRHSVATVNIDVVLRDAIGDFEVLAVNDMVDLGKNCPLDNLDCVSVGGYLGRHLEFLGDCVVHEIDIVHAHVAGSERIRVAGSDRVHVAGSERIHVAGSD